MTILYLVDDEIDVLFVESSERRFGLFWCQVVKHHCKCHHVEEIATNQDNILFGINYDMHSNG